MHIPFYKGSAPAMTDLMSGPVSVGFPGIALALPHTKAGRLRSLAVTSAARSKAMADVPTIDEAGVKGYAATLWLGLLAPEGSAAEIINRLYEEIAPAATTGRREHLFGYRHRRDDYHARTVRSVHQSQVQKWAKVDQNSRRPGKLTVCRALTGCRFSARNCESVRRHRVRSA